MLSFFVTFFREGAAALPYIFLGTFTRAKILYTFKPIMDKPPCYAIIMGEDYA